MARYITSRRAEVIRFRTFGEPYELLEAAAQWLKDHPDHWLTALNLSYEDTGNYLQMTVENDAAIEVLEAA